MAETVSSPDFESGSVTKTNFLSLFFGDFQQSVIASQTYVGYGEVIKFTANSKATSSSSNAKFIVELYKDEKLYEMIGGGTYIRSSPNIISVTSGQSYSYSWNTYFSSDLFEKGTYKMVVYLEDVSTGKLISQANDFASFQIVGVKLTESQCKSQYEGLCNGEKGVFYNCKVSTIGTSCSCDTNSCLTKEICSDGQCIPSNQCDADIFSFSTTCQQSTTNECGGIVTRSTNGETCGANAICKSGSCVKYCEDVGFIGDKSCNGNNVVQTYKNSDCTTESKIVNTCSDECSGGSCVSASSTPEILDGETNPETTPDVTSSNIINQNDQCVLASDCGSNFECNSGVCQRVVQSKDYSVWIIIAVLVIVVVGLFTINYFTLNKGKGKRRRK